MFVLLVNFERSTFQFRVSFLAVNQFIFIHFFVMNYKNLSENCSCSRYKEFNIII